MWTLIRNQVCFIDEKKLPPGTEAHVRRYKETHYFFCEDHFCHSFYKLIPAILKYRAERGGKRSMPPITDYEYQLLLQSGAMLP